MAYINWFNRHSIHAKIDKIKNGDEHQRNLLIKEYTPFIIKNISAITGNIVELENSEEFSIGLIAFNEAIDCYDSAINNNFFYFAKKVIRRRIINYIKKNFSETKVYPYAYFEEKEYNNLNNRYNNMMRSENLRLEIKELADQLSSFGISFGDLVLSSPMHKDAINNSVKIAYVLARDDKLFYSLNKKKVLPMNDLMKKLKVNKRTVERNRKYIIAVCLILRNDFDLLKTFLYEDDEER